MNALVADPQEQTAKLNLVVEAFDKVSTSSTKAAREKAVDAFLDRILAQQAFLKEATHDLKIAEIPTRALLLFTDVKPNTLSRLQALIAVMRRAHAVSIKAFVIISRSFAASNIGKSDLVLFKDALDDMKELTEDLHDRFFALPEDEEFQGLMGQLNDLLD